MYLRNMNANNSADTHKRLGKLKSCNGLYEKSSAVFLE